jgi:hypothetical protein
MRTIILGILLIVAGCASSQNDGTWNQAPYPKTTYQVDYCCRVSDVK